MALSTYAELQAAIADTLNRTDLTSAITDFITLAEAELRSDIFARGTLTEATATATAESMALPSGFRQLVNLRINGVDNVGPLERLEPHVYDGVRVGGETGTPRVYTTVGNCIKFYPVPTSTEYQVTYYADVTALSVSNTTNSTLTAYPGLYLYGALIHSAPYLRDDERIALWSAEYDRLKEKAIIANERAEFGAVPLTIRPRRAFGFGRTSSGIMRRN